MRLFLYCCLNCSDPFPSLMDQAAAPPITMSGGLLLVWNRGKIQSVAIAINILHWHLPLLEAVCHELVNEGAPDELHLETDLLVAEGHADPFCQFRLVVD